MQSYISLKVSEVCNHDGVIKWKLSPRHLPFVWGIHRWPVNSPHKGQWRGALMFHLICAWTNSLVNSRGAGDLRRHRAHYDVNIMKMSQSVVRFNHRPVIESLFCNRGPYSWTDLTIWRNITHGVQLYMLIIVFTVVEVNFVLIEMHPEVKLVTNLLDDICTIIRRKWSPFF